MKKNLKYKEFGVDLDTIFSFEDLSTD